MLHLAYYNIKILDTLYRNLAHTRKDELDRHKNMQRLNRMEEARLAKEWRLGMRRGGGRAGMGGGKGKRLLSGKARVMVDCGDMSSREVHALFASSGAGEKQVKQESGQTEFVFEKPQTPVKKEEYVERL